MTPDTVIALVGLTLLVVSSIVAVVVWLVRLEGKTTANKLATENVSISLTTHIKNQTDFMQAHALNSSNTNMEIVRVQEQMKHLTSLLERWLVPPRTRQRLRGTDTND